MRLLVEFRTGGSHDWLVGSSASLAMAMFMWSVALRTGERDGGSVVSSLSMPDMVRLLVEFLGVGRRPTRRPNNWILEKLGGGHGYRGVVSTFVRNNSNSVGRPPAENQPDQTYVTRLT